MKKKIGIVIAALAGVVVLGFGVYHTDASQTEPKLSVDQIRQLVSEQYPGTITEMELEKDFNKVVYEVEIEGNGKKYDLTLDGNSGEVLNINEKIATENKAKNENNTDNKNKADREKNLEVKEKESSKKEIKEKSNQKAVISIEEASKIALNTFAGKIKDIDLDEDDGRMIYEIEIEAGNQEAEIEIDAYTGEVLVIEMDD